MNVLIAGCGFLGEAAAGLFLEGGSAVLGLTGGSESAGRLGSLGIPAIACDITCAHPDLPQAWRDPDVLVHSASSGRGGPDAYSAVYRDGLRNLLAACRPRQVIFVGSTSVYAQAGGEWVDEECAAEPTTATGRILREAEEIALGHGGTVLRLSGIYGPGRSVLLRKYQEGTAVLEDGGERWINQIHRDDGASAIVHASRLRANAIFNVCDNRPATQKEVYGWIAAHFAGPLPPMGAAPATRKRGNSNKRVSNQKLRATGWQPAYPDYRSALQRGI